MVKFNRYTQPFIKRSTDLRRRLFDLAVVYSISPIASAASTLALATILLNGESEILRKEVRIGKNQKPFIRYRLKPPVAPKILTRLTEFLKRTHAYDTPLFLNVLLGDMSLVGPEAIIEETLEHLADHEMGRFAIRPGLTDTYQIRRKMNIAFEGRSILERSYLAERGIRKDISILLRTVPALILGKSNPVHVNTFKLQDISVANITMGDAVSQLLELSTDRNNLVLFANPHCFNISRKDSEYKRILQQSDLVLPDGIGVRLAGAMIGAEVMENVNGTDLFPRLCERAAQTGHSLYLLGGEPGVVEAVKDRITDRFPRLNIAGMHHGFFTDDSAEEREILSDINRVRPDFLLVARGVPLQEKWLARHIQELDVGVGLGVGGLFDFYSDRIPRAPVWVRELGMEWFWRFAQEPRRMFRRYFIGNPEFLYHVWRWYLSQARTELITRFDGIDTPNRRLRAETYFHLRRFAWWLATDGTAAIKRAGDIVGSASGLAALTPLFTCVAAAIKLEDPAGPVFFTQKRIGKHGREFDMYKFRSMYSDAEVRKEALMEQNEHDIGVTFKIKNDPRITRVGRIIRRFSIDELPQLWNVLSGDMSLVGPRPPLPSEVSKYTMADRDRLEVTPGLTCLWQVQGRSLLDFDQQVLLDREYIQRQSLWVDIQLILKTIPAVLSGYGAY